MAKFNLQKIQAVTLVIAIILLFLPATILAHKDAMLVVAGFLGINALINYFK